MGLTKLSSSTVRGTFWSTIAFCKKNILFQTLSKTLSTFCQNHFGRIVITAIFITSGAFLWKELLSKNLCFFIIFQPREGNLWTSVEQISARISKLHFYLLKGQLEVGNSIFQKKFPIIEWRNSTFWKKIFGMAAKFPFYVSVQSFWEKHTSKNLYRISFFGPLVNNAQLRAKKVWGRLSKIFLALFLFSDIEHKMFLLFAKILGQFIWNSSLRVRRLILSKIFGLQKKFSSFSYHQHKTFLVNSFGWKFQNWTLNSQRNFLSQNSFSVDRLFLKFRNIEWKNIGFSHILFGKMFKTAFYMSNGKKRCCFETQLFFTIFRPWAGIFPVFVESVSARFLGVHSRWPKSTIWGKGFVSRIIFSSLSHTQRKSFSLFAESSWHDSQKCTLRVQWICWTVERKDFFWKKNFFTPFVVLELKKLGFCWTFSGVGSKFAINVAEKNNLSKKTYFSKTALW